MPGRYTKRNETENQFEGLLGQGQQLDNEKGMADLLNDMSMSVKKHTSKKDSGLQNSDEYKNVQAALNNVVFTTNGSFTNDVAANEKMMTQVMGNYYKLLSACEIYIAKPGGFSLSGRARKAKVREIQSYAQRDIMGIEQAFFAMKSMSGEQQSTLSWDEIMHSSRMEIIEIDDYAKTKSLGSGVKQGDNAAKLLKEGVFAPESERTWTISANGYNQTSGNGANIISNNFSDSEVNKELNKNNVTTSVSNRNVATSRVANLVGLGDIVEQSKNVVVKDKKGVEKKGTLMSTARGKEVKANYSGSILGDDVKQRENAAKEKISPTFQKELSSLQVLDYLCNQGDRHRGNYFAETDSNGRLAHLHGIDNDTSFGTGVDAEKALAGKEEGLYGGGTFWRIVVDSDDNLVIPHMDRQLAKNIIDLKPEEIEFVLKDLIEPIFIEQTKKRLKKLQIAIKKEENNSESKLFLDEGQWDENSLEDFLEAGSRHKVDADLEDKFSKKPINYLTDKYSTIEERVNLSKGDNYISVLVDDMIGFDIKFARYLK